MHVKESCLVRYGIYGNRCLRPLERIIKFNEFFDSVNEITKRTMDKYPEFVVGFVFVDPCDR